MGFVPKSPPPLPNVLPELGTSVFVVDDPPPNIELDAGVAVLEVDELFPNIPPGLLPPNMPPPPRVVDPDGAAVFDVEVPLPNCPSDRAVVVPKPNRPPDGAGFAEGWGKQSEETKSLLHGLTSRIGGLTKNPSAACSPRRVPKGTSRISTSTPGVVVLWWIKETTHFKERKMYTRVTGQ